MVSMFFMYTSIPPGHPHAVLVRGLRSTGPRATVQLLPTGAMRSVIVSPSMKYVSLVFRGAMLPQELHALVVSTTNRMLQRCSVAVIFETTIDPIITEELCNDGGAVVVHCPVSMYV